MADSHSRRLNIGTLALIGLAAGLAAGALVSFLRNDTLRSAAAAVEVVGTMWINAILMTILPLVVAKLFVSIAAHDDGRAIGRTGWRAALLYVALLGGTAVLAMAVMPAVFAWMPISAEASAALRAAARPAGPPAAPLTASQVLLSFVPGNAFRAAADGALVPVMLFTIVFAFGASRVDTALRHTLVTVFKATDAAITQVLRWIVNLAPYGVFALGLGLALNVGVSVVGSLAYYIVVSSATMVAITAALYGVVWLGTRVTPIDFARAAGPAQVVAFGTHSSLASLPAMLQGSERLRLSQTATGFVLPLSLAVFKFSGPAWFVVIAHFVARLYGLDIEATRGLAVIVAAVATSVAIGGVPSGAAVVAAPVLAAAGLPVEAMGVLLAVDPIPNAFRTVANVTGMMAAAALSDGRQRPEPPTALEP